MNNPNRNSWLQMSDEDLLKSCKLQHFKASGPGGQHRNKVSSAVRLEHTESGLTVTSTNSRNQHENKKHALTKLRYEIAFNVRSNMPIELESIDMSQKNKRYPQWVAHIFDILDTCGYELKPSAESLDISSSRLAKLLHKHPQVWQTVNNRRNELGLKPLKS